MSSPQCKLHPFTIRRPALAAALSFCLLEGCATPASEEPSCPADGGLVEPSSHEMLNAALWVQSSGEYEAVTRQIYRMASQSLDLALADPHWSAALEQSGDVSSLPPAIMLDIDETVLGNARYEARIALEHGQFSPPTFEAWCNEANAVAVPGAKAFLDYAASKGVAIFYFSGRKQRLRQATLANLEKLGLPTGGAQNRLLLADGSSKSERRAKVAKDFRILLLLGDNLEDFISGSHAPPEQRRELARRHASRWGVKWIILPNPMYGHWEAAFYGFDYGSSRAAQLQQKRSGLRR